MKKLNLLVASLFGIASAVALMVGVASLNQNPSALSNATGGEEIHSDTLTITDMSKITSDAVYTKDGNKITFIGEDSGFSSAGVLTNGKKLYNQTIINGLTSVTVVSSGSIKILGGWYQSGSSSFVFYESSPVASGTGTVAADFGTSSPGYFAILADGANTTISSITIGYACSETKQTLTLHLYTTNNLNDENTNVIIDSNWSIDDEWINGKGLAWNKMTYVAKEGDYYHFSYNTSLPYGLVRFQFVLRNTSDTYTSTISGHSDWKPHGFYLTGNTTWYCYCDDGFPTDDSHTNVFTVYDHEVSPINVNITLTLPAEETNAVSIIYDINRTGTDSDWIDGLGWTAMTHTGGTNVYTFSIEVGEGAEFRFIFATWTSEKKNTFLVGSADWKPVTLTMSESCDVIVAEGEFPAADGSVQKANVFTYTAS